MINTERNSKKLKKIKENKRKEEKFINMYVMCHWKVFIVLPTM